MMAWEAPPTWSVPHEWSAYEPCFIICGGPSVNQQLDLVKRIGERFTAKIIAVKHAAKLRPDADVLFISGEDSPQVAADVVGYFHGRYIVVRGKGWDGMPSRFLRVSRSKEHTKLSDRPTHVSGYDTGTSAINLAYSFGARTIILLGYDMCGGHWFSKGGFSFHVPDPPQAHFDRHTAPLPGLAEDCKRKGVRVVNCSPISKVTCFERGKLEDWL